MLVHERSGRDADGSAVLRRAHLLHPHRAGEGVARPDGPQEPHGAQLLARDDVEAAEHRLDTEPLEDGKSVDAAGDETAEVRFLRRSGASTWKYWGSQSRPKASTSSSVTVCDPIFRSTPMGICSAGRRTDASVDVPGVASVIIDSSLERLLNGTVKDFPRTRQSSLTLAAFRPWGSSQDDAAWEAGSQSSPAPSEGRTGPCRGLQALMSERPGMLECPHDFPRPDSPRTRRPAPTSSPSTAMTVPASSQG